MALGIGELADLDALHHRVRAREPRSAETLGLRERLLFGGQEEHLLRGRPGEVLAQRDGAICRATGDGAV